VSPDSCKHLPEGCIKVQHLFDLAWHLDGCCAGCVLFDLAGLHTQEALAAVESIRKRYRSLYYLYCLLYDGSTLIKQDLLTVGFDDVVVQSACDAQVLANLMQPRAVAKMYQTVEPEVNGDVRTEETA